MIKTRLSQGINCNNCSVSYLCIAHELPSIDIDKLNELISTVRHISKKEHVSQAHSNMQNLYAIRRGSCKEYWIDVDGNECVTNFYFPGDIIGIESVSGQKNIFSVVTLEDTQLCVIPVDDFLKTMYQHPNILKRFLNINSLKMQNDQSVRMGVTAVEKTCDFLLNIVSRMYERNPNEKEIILSMSQVDISNFLGVAYETVNRILKDLKRQKIIKLKNRTFEVLDLSRLKELGRLDYSMKKKKNIFDLFFELSDRVEIK